ncbi:MAG TPA: 5'-nucleotidase C-terminal domain-containing protein, partial [Gemmatimonadales bacterium]
KSNVRSEFTAGLRFGDGALAIRDVLADVRAQRPDLTVLLAHAGAACQGNVCTGEVIRLAEGVPPRALDLIIGGQTDNPMETRVSGISIVKATSGGAGLAVADVVKTPAGGREIRTRIEPVVSSQVAQDSAMAELVEGYLRKADTLASRAVATVKFPLFRADDEYRLASLIAEARRNVLRADLGLVRNDDIRADLPAGRVSYGQVFEIQSSQNSLVKVTLSGRQLSEVLEQSLDRRGQPTAQVSGAVVRYDPRRPARKRIKEVEFKGGRKLQADATYTLAVDDFLAAGGDGYTMLIGKPSEPAGLLDVDGLIAYLKRLPQPVEVTGVTGFFSTRR